MLSRARPLSGSGGMRASTVGAVGTRCRRALSIGTVGADIPAGGAAAVPLRLPGTLPGGADVALDGPIIELGADASPWPSGIWLALMRSRYADTGIDPAAPERAAESVIVISFVRSEKWNDDSAGTISEPVSSAKRTSEVRRSPDSSDCMLPASAPESWPRGGAFPAPLPAPATPAAREDRGSRGRKSVLSRNEEWFEEAWPAAVCGGLVRKVSRVATWTWPAWSFGRRRRRGDAEGADFSSRTCSACRLACRSSSSV